MPIINNIERAEMSDHIELELAKARQKFPAQSILHTLCALTEEVGELNQAYIQYAFEPHKNKTKEDVYKEAVQVCVMAMRVVLDAKE